jgi:hypothetical protein
MIRLFLLPHALLSVFLFAQVEQRRFEREIENKSKRFGWRWKGSRGLSDREQVNGREEQIGQMKKSFDRLRRRQMSVVTLVVACHSDHLISSLLRPSLHAPHCDHAFSCRTKPPSWSELTVRTGRHSLSSMLFARMSSIRFDRVSVLLSMTNKITPKVIRKPDSMWQVEWKISFNRSNQF